jgi:hypothetical protein
MRMSRSLSGSPFGFARLVSFGLIALLVTPLVAPVAAQWEEDSWLVNIIGPERLALGDEIGCHGIPGKDIRQQPEAITECLDYITERTNASKWGVNPISFGLPEGEIDQQTLDSVHSANILAVGHSELRSTTNSELRIFDFAGGSFEKTVGSVEQFEAVKESGAPIINMFWKARDHDVVVRPDSELVAAIESTTAWFTTWGEYTSYHAIESNFTLNSIDNKSWLVEYNDWPDVPQAWKVPITNSFTGFGADVVNVYQSSMPLPELSAGEPHLQEGWRQEGDTLYLTLMSGKTAIVLFDSNHSFDSTTGELAEFNGHEVAITVAGIHTYDLFYWSKRWDDTPMRFTWLVEPREVGAFNWWLPVVAAIVAIAAPIALYSVVKRDHRARGVAEVFDSLDQIQLEEE